MLKIFFTCVVTLLSLPVLGQQKTDSIVQTQDTTIILVEAVLYISGSKLNTQDLLQGFQPELINALDQLPGFFKVHEAGFPLVYRGMSASRLRIERNGVLRTGFVAQGYLLEDINPGNVKDFSVIKGVESVLYGSGSSGGMVNIQELVPQATNWQNVFLSYGTNAHHKIAGFQLNRGGKGIQWLLSGRIMDTNDFKFGTGETAQNSARAQNQIKLSLQSQLAKNTSLTWNHDWSNGSIERPQGFQNNPFELRSYKNRFTYQSNLNAQSKLNDGQKIEQNLWLVLAENDQEISNYNGTFTQLNIFERRNYQQESFGYRLNWNGTSKSSFTWRAGFDLIYNDLDQIDTRDDYINNVFDLVSFSQSRKERMGGIFGMGSLQKERIRIDLSVRGDLASIGNNEEKVNYEILSGGIGLEWNTAKGMTQNFSLARKFRYPTQDESLGEIFGGRGIFRGNPNIEPEKSTEFEWESIGILGQNWRYSFSAWLVFFEDRISEVFLGNNEFTYENISRARTMGIDARIDRNMLAANHPDKLTLSFTTSLIQGDELEEGWFSSGEPLIGIPAGRYALSTRWEKHLTRSFSLQTATDLEFVTAFDRLPSGTIRQTFGVQAADSYWLLNLNLSGHLQLGKNRLELGVRANNLTNAAYYPFGARIMGMGRNFNLFTRFTF